MASFFRSTMPALVSAGLNLGPMGDLSPVLGFVARWAIAHVRTARPTVH